MTPWPHITVLLGALMVLGMGPSVRLAPATVLPQRQLPPLADTGKLPQQHLASLRRAGFPGPVEAQFTRIIDGDTFEARIRIWFGQEITTLVRIRGIDAPELKGRCPGESVGAQQASQALAEFLASANIQLRNISLDKFGGRVVATVTIGDPAFAGDAPEDVAGLMLATGLARPYGGGRRQSWCGLAAQAG